MQPVTDYIPQRPPFLFVDSILERKDNKIITQKFLSGDESFFSGHFPGNPVMPGVLMFEALFQTGAIFLNAGAGEVGVISRVDKAKFKNMARPGETLRMEVELVEQIDNAYEMKGKVFSQQKLLLSCTFRCAKVFVQ